MNEPSCQGRVSVSPVECAYLRLNQLPLTPACCWVDEFPGREEIHTLSQPGCRTWYKAATNNGAAFCPTVQDRHTKTVFQQECAKLPWLPNGRCSRLFGLVNGPWVSQRFRITTAQGLDCQLPWDYILCQCHYALPTLCRLGVMVRAP